MQAFLFLTALAAASAVDCRKRTIPDFLCLLTAAAGLISFSPAQFFGVLAALPLLIAALIRPECMGGGDIKLTAAAGFVLGFWRGIWENADKFLTSQDEIILELYPPEPDPEEKPQENPAESEPAADSSETAETEAPAKTEEVA